MSIYVNFKAIEISISKERLRRYQTSDDDVSSAIALYERNTRLAEAFYTALQGFEICFRNKIHAALEEDYGAQCLMQDAIPLIADGALHLRDAKRRLQMPRRVLSEGAIVAELSLGFWVGLIGPPYDANLWRRSLFKVFSKNGRPMRRKDVHGRFNAIRRFRNRIAHHEPIWDQDVVGRHAEIIEAIGWMCGDTALWVDRRSRLPHLAVIP